MNNISSIKEGQDYLYQNYDNIEVENIDSNQSECFVFFSSNGIYEDSFDKFYKTMIDEKRYEWKSIAEAVKKRKKVAKIIYVRDVYKRYYIYGINDKLNSINSMLEKLKEFTEGYTVTTIGISSGGYMAVVAGTFLKAERIFSISGQFEIKSCLTKEEIYNVKECDREFLNMAPKLNGSKVFYFCPIGCENDRKNYDLIKDIESVNSFLFNSERHADTVYPFNFPDIFCMKDKKLEKLAYRQTNKIMNKFYFAVKTFTWQGILELVMRAIKVRFDIANFKKIWDVK